MAPRPLPPGVAGPALIVKNSQILVGIYFIFLKKRRRPHLKDFQYKIWTSVERSGK